MDRIAVKIENIEQMILMSDKVLDEVMMGGISKYDSNGAPLPPEKEAEQLEEDKRDGTRGLVWNIVHEEHEDFDEVLSTAAADLEKKLAHLKKRILGIFRTGILEEWFRFYYYADDSVPDDWLFTMFLMRLRDRMIVFASHKLNGSSEADE